MLVGLYSFTEKCTNWKNFVEKVEKNVTKKTKDIFEDGRLEKINLLISIIITCL